jgi:hypothetical protein
MAVSLVVLLLLFLFAWRKTQPRSAPRHGLLIAAVAYAPASSVFGIYRWTADSYMYLPLAGLALGLVPAVAQAWPLRMRQFGLGATAALVGLLACSSFVNTSRWSSSPALWAGSIDRYPERPLAWEHEGLALQADGEWAAGDALFLQMAEKFPDFEDTLSDYVRAYRAVGDESKAQAALLRGVRAGQVECLRMYWMELVASPSLPTPDQRPIVELAFRKGFEAMKQGLTDPMRFQRVVQILQSLGLTEMAAAAEVHTQTLTTRK